MPIYEFECPKCKREEEVITKVNVKLNCPDCDIQMRKKVSAFHIRGIWRWYKSSDYGAAGR